jgi:hypothetical protein
MIELYKLRLELELAELKLHEEMQEIHLQLQEIYREVDFETDLNYILRLLNYSIKTENEMTT